MPSDDIEAAEMIESVLDGEGIEACLSVEELELLRSVAGYLRND